MADPNTDRTLNLLEIPLSNLLLDERNARILDEQPTQQAAMLALAEQEGQGILNLAEDIIREGRLDPLSFPGVFPTPGQPGYYTVIEGNRRVCALKALETPSSIAPSLSKGQERRLRELSALYARRPIRVVRCVVFESEEESLPWVIRRHSGQAGGIGLVEWGADQKDRFLARHGKDRQRAPGGQVIDFVEAHGTLSPAARTSRKGVISSINRLLSTRAFQDRLGIEVDDGIVYSWYPASEVAKGLTRVMEDLKLERKRTKDIYHKQDREDYTTELPEEQLPDPDTRLAERIPLTQVYERAPEPIAPKGGRTRPKSKKRPRVGPVDRELLIPPDLVLNVSGGRMPEIVRELRTLKLADFPNAISVLFRVFLELSVDHYLRTNGLLAPQQTTRGMPLAKRMKDAAEDMRKKGVIDVELEELVTKVADGKHHLLAAEVVTLHMYVHNRYVFPKGPELRIAWNELEPFITKLWP